MTGFTPHFISFDGAPVTGRVPTTVRSINGVVMTGEQRGQAAQAYQSFCTECALSPGAGFYVRNYVLNDGTFVRIIRNGAHDQVLVSPVGLGGAEKKGRVYVLISLTVRRLELESPDSDNPDHAFGFFGVRAAEIIYGDDGSPSSYIPDFQFPEYDTFKTKKLSKIFSLSKYDLLSPDLAELKHSGVTELTSVTHNFGPAGGYPFNHRISGTQSNTHGGVSGFTAYDGKIVSWLTCATLVDSGLDTSTPWPTYPYKSHITTHFKYGTDTILFREGYVNSEDFISIPQSPMSSGQPGMTGDCGLRGNAWYVTTPYWSNENFTKIKIANPIFISENQILFDGFSGRIQISQNPGLGGYQNSVYLMDVNGFLNPDGSMKDIYAVRNYNVWLGNGFRNKSFLLSTSGDISENGSALWTPSAADLSGWGDFSRIGINSPTQGHNFIFTEGKFFKRSTEFIYNIPAACIPLALDCHLRREPGGGAKFRLCKRDGSVSDAVLDISKIKEVKDDAEFLSLLNLITDEYQVADGDATFTADGFTTIDGKNHKVTAAITFLSDQKDLFDPNIKFEW